MRIRLAHLRVATCFCLAPFIVAPFVMAPAMEVTKDNLIDAYHIAWHKDPPPEVLQALGQ